MFGSKLENIINKTLHPSHKCHPHHHITHNDSRDRTESNNNFAGTNPAPVLDAAGLATNNFSGTNPRPATRDDGNNNFTGLSPAALYNNFPGTNPQSWVQRHPASCATSSTSSCVTSDAEGDEALIASSKKRRFHRYVREKREEEDGNNFPGANPDNKKSFWSFSGREWEEGNNFPGTNPNSR